MKAQKILKGHYETYGIRAVSAFPSGMYPQIAINDQNGIQSMRCVLN
jgi:hypothetical protein